MKASLDTFYGRIEIGRAAKQILDADDLPEYGAVVALPWQINLERTSTRGRCGVMPWRCQWDAGPILILTDPGEHTMSGVGHCFGSTQPVSHRVSVSDLGSGRDIALVRRSVQRKTLQALVADGGLARWELLMALDQISTSDRMVGSVRARLRRSTPYRPTVEDVAAIAGALVVEGGLGERLLAIHAADPYRLSLRRRAIAKISQELMALTLRSLGDPARGGRIRLVAAAHPGATVAELRKLYGLRYSDQLPSDEAVMQALWPASGARVSWDNGLDAVIAAPAPAEDDALQERCELILEAQEIDEMLRGRKYRTCGPPGWYRMYQEGESLRYWLANPGELSATRRRIEIKHRTLALAVAA